eukprot:GCRY01003248.1.p1 GENE.GCRY01003248.1~~GCRY01003248.1.p1  ORF type:complete len:376 (+),score=65.62 GCRY01003248.1:96-1223(+)
MDFDSQMNAPSHGSPANYASFPFDSNNSVPNGSFEPSLEPPQELGQLPLSSNTERNYAHEEELKEDGFDNTLPEDTLPITHYQALDNEAFAQMAFSDESHFPFQELPVYMPEPGVGGVPDLSQSSIADSSNKRIRKRMQVGGAHRKNSHKKRKIHSEKRPKGFVSAYFHYYRAMHVSIEQELYPDGSKPDSRVIAKVAGERWKSMDSVSKAIYEEMAKRDKERFEREWTEFAKKYPMEAKEILSFQRGNRNRVKRDWSDLLSAADSGGRHRLPMGMGGSAPAANSFGISPFEDDYMANSMLIGGERDGHLVGDDGTELGLGLADLGSLEGGELSLSQISPPVAFDEMVVWLSMNPEIGLWNDRGGGADVFPRHIT